MSESSNPGSAGHGLCCPYTEESIKLTLGIGDSILNLKTHRNSFEKWGTNPDVVIINHLRHNHRARVGIDEVGTCSWIMRSGHKTKMLLRSCVSFVS